VPGRRCATSRIRRCTSRRMWLRCTTSRIRWLWWEDVVAVHYVWVDPPRRNLSCNEKPCAKYWRASLLEAWVPTCSGQNSGCAVAVLARRKLLKRTSVRSHTLSEFLFLDFVKPDSATQLTQKTLQGPSVSQRIYFTSKPEFCTVLSSFFPLTLWTNIPPLQ
jgi:hypothetical protein